MEQTLQQQWEKVLQSLLEIVQNGLDKAPDYVLDFFNRFQLWVLLENIVCVIISWIIGWLIWYSLYKLSKKDIDREYCDSVWHVVWAVFWILGVITSIIIICFNIHDIVQILVMPELSLIEFLKTYH